MKKNKNIRIVSGAKMEDGILLPKYKNVKVSPNYGKRYFVGFEKRLQLNYCESYLLEWLVEQVDEDNAIIGTDAYTRQKFINFILRISQTLDKEIHYKDETIKAAFKTLKRLEFIITPENRRGWAWLNPKYFFKGHEPDRYQIIKDIENSMVGNTDSIMYSKHSLTQEINTLEREWEEGKTNEELIQEWHD